MLATTAGYGFGRFRFRGSGVAFGLIIVTLMIPFQAILTPLFLQLNAMRLTDSLLGLVLFYATVNLPFGVFVMRTAFASIPDALEEAARIDGAGTTRTFLHVLRPLVVAGMATTALYAFLAAWTEFLGALTFLTKQDLYTLPVSLVNLQPGQVVVLDTPDPGLRPKRGRGGVLHGGYEKVRVRASRSRLRTGLLPVTGVVDEAGSHHEYRHQDRPGDLIVLRRRCPDGGGARPACRRTR